MIGSPRWSYRSRPGVAAALLALLTGATVIGSAAGATLAAGIDASPPASAADFRFEVTLAREAASEIAALGLEVPVTGRAYVIVSRDGGREPRAQVRVTGVPFWGRDVEGLGPGGTVEIDARRSAESASLARAAGLSEVEVTADLFGRDRILTALQPGGSGGR